MNRLENKVAVITGGAMGQGAAEARLFAREGATVAVCDIAEEKGQEVVASILEAGGKAKFFPLDVSKEEDWTATRDAVHAWAGATHVLVNNAAIVMRKGILDTDLADFRKIMAVNVEGPHFGMRAFAPLMRDSGGGSIINVSSSAGLIGFFDAAYTASKWALRGLSKTAALEFSPWGIRVNVICPTLILTPLNQNQEYIQHIIKMVPQKRAGTPEEIAGLALFLASDECKYLTGEDISADGGMMAGSVLWEPMREAGLIPRLSA